MDQNVDARIPLMHAQATNIRASALVWGKRDSGKKMGRNVVSRQFQALASKHAACAKDCCWDFWPQGLRHL